jgi:hypothetical protein
MHTQMQKTELTCAEYIQSNICSAVDPWFPEAQFLDVVDAQCHQPQGVPGGWHPRVGVRTIASILGSSAICLSMSVHKIQTVK